MVAVRLYVEGGGDAKRLRSACRRGFRELFRKAGLEGAVPRIIASGSRQSAYEDFCIALKQDPDTFALLLVDSEAPVLTDSSAWTHLQKQSGDHWSQPSGAKAGHCHLMVQCMENWFLADRKMLSSYFGQGFNDNALPRRKNIEAISKADVLKGLRDASRFTKTKGSYNKGRHSFDILALVDASLVRQASKYADRLFNCLAHPESIR